MFRLLKLKPPHGWSAVAWELAIVTLGVLIALGAQQVVDDIHGRTQARDAESEIRGELAHNIAMLRSRWAVRRCVENRVDELQKMIGSAGKEGTIVTPNWVGRPQFWTMQMARWQTTSQSGRAALLPPDELALYGSLYSFMENVNALTSEEQLDWARLRDLEHLQRLTPEMAFQLTNTLQEARYINWRMGIWTMQIETLANRLHLPAGRNDIPASRSACVPMTTPREQAIRESNSAFGTEP
jgi:hypothetical protein